MELLPLRIGPIPEDDADVDATAPEGFARSLFSPIFRFPSVVEVSSNGDGAASLLSFCSPWAHVRGESLLLPLVISRTTDLFTFLADHLTRLVRR